MVVYPEGVWYSQLKPEKITRIVKEHFIEGSPVTQWAIQDMNAAKQEITAHNQHIAAMNDMLEKSGMIPEELHSQLRGFMESRILLTAVELDLFTAIGDGATAEKIAETLNTNQRSTEALLNALTAIEAIEKDSDIYKNSSATQMFLTEGSKFNSRLAIMHIVELWHSWSTLTDCVKKGTSVRLEEGHKRDASGTKAFIAAMHKNASTRAIQTVSSINIEHVKHVLDLGGGSGAYAMAFAKKNKETKCTVFDVPAVIPLTKQYVKDAGLTDRIDFIEGDMNTDSFDTGYDMVWISAICHMWGPNENQDLIKRVYRSLNPGGQVVIQDFILNDEKTGPRMGAVFALNMLVNTKAGSSYSRKEYSDWLSTAGFGHIELKPMPGPTALIIGKKP